MMPQTQNEAQKRLAANLYGETSKRKENVEDIVTRHLPLVKSIVGKIKMRLPDHIDFNDLYSVGVTGLISAVQKYDPLRNRSFSSFAFIRIRGAILDELRRLDWMPRGNRAQAKMLQETISGLETKLKRPVEEHEIRKELGMSIEEYGKLMKKVRPISIISLDQSTDSSNEDSPPLKEAIADTSQAPIQDKVENKEMIALLKKRIATLPDAARKVLAMYYFEGMRLSEIAEVFNLTESRICQIHAQAIASLRAYIDKVSQ
jgi:RNA polymerase sigma factor for flagellar operon FliA